MAGNLSRGGPAPPEHAMAYAQQVMNEEIYNECVALIHALWDTVEGSPWGHPYGTPITDYFIWLVDVVNAYEDNYFAL